MRERDQNKSFNFPKTHCRSTRTRDTPLENQKRKNATCLQKKSPTVRGIAIRGNYGDGETKRSHSAEVKGARHSSADEVEQAGSLGSLPILVIWGYKKGDSAEGSTPREGCDAWFHLF